MDHLGVLCDKLEAPHPQLQRLAVSSIFQRLLDSRNPSSFLESGPGKEALDRCITSRSPCIVDQSIRELCFRAKSGLLPLPQAMTILQISLDSVNSPVSVSVIVDGIGFVCRLWIARSSGGAGEGFSVHPLLKALKSREEASSGILRQLRLIFSQTKSSLEQGRALSFVQPLLASVLLEPSVTTFARELFSTLCLVAITSRSLAPSLLELLLSYTRARPLNSPQNVDFLSEALQEVIDVLEEFPETKICNRVMELLFSFWQESRENSLSPLPFVSLVRRLSSIAEIQHRDSHVSSLSYLLATAETEQEQVLILSIAQSWLEAFSGLCVLYFIFPALHLMASPSAPVKKSAISLLRKIECSISGLKSTSSSNATVAGRASQVLSSLWLQEDSKTWTPVNGEAVSIPAEGYSVAYLKRLCALAGDDDGKADRGFPMLLAMLATAMIFHPVPSVAIQATKLLATIGRRHSIWGMSLMPVLLFSLKFHLRNGQNSDTIIALLNALPDLCGHSTSLPLAMHFLRPMVEYDRTLAIKPAATRLILKAWKNADRAYVYLQGSLLPDNFSGATSKSEVLLSKAISLREACEHDPDTGVELILSVQACIESKLAIVKALGLQSLASLCSDDAIDFYTAWKVISSIFSASPQDPDVAQSLGLLLKHGALDAAAHPEEAQAVLLLLWKLSTSQQAPFHKARLTAIESLCAYEVETLKESMNSEQKHLEVLFLEADSAIAQELVAKFLDHEHRNRQRAANTKVVTTKVGKLLENAPLTYCENAILLRESPGSFLEFRKATREQTTSTKKAALAGESEEFRSQFQNAAEVLNISGDLILALVSLRSWSFFMAQWLSFESRRFASDDKALEHIVKTCIRASEEGVPRLVENSMLALGGLCQHLSQARFETLDILSSHFNSRLNEPASGQWSAAISSGVMTSLLHPTDWTLKDKKIRSLAKLAHSTNDPLVVGSVGVGLGFAFQSFSSSSSANEEALLSEMLECVLELLERHSPHSSPALQALSQQHRASSTSGASTSGASTSGDDSFWAVVGLAWALGCSTTAFSKAGKPDKVRSVTRAILSWIPDSLGDSSTGSLSLASGAFLVASTCVESSEKLELLEPGTIEKLLARFDGFVRRVIELPESKQSLQPWLAHVFRASCVGGGEFLASVLKGGRHPLSLEAVEKLLGSFREGFTALELPQFCFSAMLGFSNVLGAGIFSGRSSGAAAAPASIDSQDGSRITTPLLFSSVCEETLRRTLQQIVNISHTSPDTRVRSHAKWSLGIMHTTWLQLSREVSSSDNKAIHWSYQPTPLSSLPETSTLRFLSHWLSSIGVSKLHVASSQAVSVMKCLERAPRLPLLDWGGLIRRLLQHREWFSEDTANATYGEVRKQCLLFCLRHAPQVPPLASVLDEFLEFSRLSTMEPGLQGFLLNHLGDLQTSFSSSRLEKLLGDITRVLLELHGAQAREFRIHCWRGLESFYSNEKKYPSVVERFACKLVSLLKLDDEQLEFAAALSFLKRSRVEWLLETFPVNAGDDPGMSTFILSRLVANKTLSSSALKGARSWLVDQELSSITIPRLTELASSLRNISHEEKLEWLLSSLEAVYISRNPATALQFVAMISSVWSPHSYILPANESAIEDLPHCLGALVVGGEGEWIQSAGLLTSKIFRLVEWLASSGFENSGKLLSVVRETALALRRHATPDIILKLL